MKRSIQIITVLFSISLFAAYVVYSQITRTNNPTNSFAPSSKSRRIDLPEQAWPQSPPAMTNTNLSINTGGVIVQSNLTVSLTSQPFLPSSKFSTVFTPADGGAPPTNVSQPPPAFFPGSKSAAVFTPADTAALASQPGSNVTTNIYQIIQPGSVKMMPSSKSLILLSPAQLTNVLNFTNPPNP